MSNRRFFLILLLCAFAVPPALFSSDNQSQQPAPGTPAMPDASCLYEFERGVISDCLQKASNGELSVKQQVLKRFHPPSCPGAHVSARKLPRVLTLWHSTWAKEVTMRSLILLLTLASSFPCQRAFAQTEPPIVPGARVPGHKTAEDQLYAEDGGARGGVLESIVIPPKTKAPFTLILETEWARSLSDGGNITNMNKRRIARDAEGRIYQERWSLAPKTELAESQMTAIQISDPHTHTLYNCFMLRAKKECAMISYTPSPDTIFNFQPPPSGPLPDDMGDRVRQDLGKQLVSGVEAIGTRDTANYNPGMFGNDHKMTIDREFWYAPGLGFNLLSKRSDPRIGTQTFTVTNLILSEPDPKLFEMPEGFTVVDRRQTALPQN
jgi:hypothetical protein